MTNDNNKSQKSYTPCTCLLFPTLVFEEAKKAQEAQKAQESRNSQDRDNNSSFLSKILGSKFSDKTGKNDDTKIAGNYNPSSYKGMVVQRRETQVDETTQKDCLGAGAGV